jgi:putative ATP-binding cassette transporter
MFGRRFARDLWRLVRIYWTTPDARTGGLLLALAIALELAAVHAAVLIADAERGVFDALGNRDTTAFFATMSVFVVVILGFALASTYRVYVRQRLEIRWRRHVTTYFVERWMGPEAYCQALLQADGLDNPDQRIAEDVRSFVASALGLSLSLLSAVATLYSFGRLLWLMSATWPVRVGSLEWQVPGLMLWVAILYAVIATVVTHLVGRRLIPINFDRLRVEADFRYGLVRFRDNVESVALARGQDREREGARARFGAVVGNWLSLIGAQRNLTLFTTGIGQANGLLPVLIGAPAYFAGRLTLGSLAQTRIAYGQFSAALAWFVNAYQEIAQWRASIERLSTFLDAMDATSTRMACEGIRIEPGKAPALTLHDVRLRLPDGRMLLDGANGRIDAGERVAIVGPAGTGKTTLFRAIAGIWPFGEGHIETPAGARAMFLTQRPYLPLGTLRAALSYPATAGAFPDEKVREVLQFVGLARLAPRLDLEEPWDRSLSADEQQRVVLARVLLHEPDWIFADDATASLDEVNERRVYEVVRARLPKATIVSITQRPGVLPYHERRWTMVAGDGGRVTLEAA